MAESIVQVTEGSGKKLWTWQWAVGANNVEQEVVAVGPQPWETAEAHANASTATANDHLLTLNAGGSKKVRITRILLEQSANATTAAFASLQILRTTTGAPTGGTAITPNPFETADSIGATARSLPTTKGTESTILFDIRLAMRQAISATQTQSNDRWLWVASPFGKGIIIPAGTTNGIAIKSTAAVAAGGIICSIEFVETSF